MRLTTDTRPGTFSSSIAEEVRAGLPLTQEAAYASIRGDTELADLLAAAR